MLIRAREFSKDKSLGWGILLVTASLLLGWLFAVVTINFGIPFTQTEILVFVLLFIVILAPFILATIRRKIDIFQPIYMMTMITFVYFIVVPIALGYKSSGFLYYSVDYRSMLVKSEIVVLVALLGFYAGYYLGNRYIHPKGITLSDTYKKRVRKITFVAGSVASLLVATWIFVGGFPIWALNIFDTRASYGTWFDLSSINLGYLYSARLAFIPLLILFLAFRPQKYPSIYWIVAYLVVGVLYLVMGIRIVPVTLILGSIIYVYLERDSRPNIFLIILAGFGLFLFNGFVGYARGSNQDIILSINSSWDAFLEGNSLIFGLAMIVLIFPDLIAYQGGRILLSDLLVPIPRMLWAAKPGNTIMEKINYLIPIEYSPPVFGSWFADFGFVGPFIAMFLLGLGCAYVYQSWKQNPDNPFARVLLSVSLASLLMIYTRVNVVVINWIFWVILPVILIRIIAGYRILPDQIIADNVSTINGVK